MKIKNFFNFNSKLLSSTFQASAVDLGNDRSGLNNHYNLIKGKYEEINFPVAFKQEYGKKFTDILDTGWPGLFLISDSMKKILEYNQLTGWKTFPIKLCDKKGNEISGYHGFSVLGICGLVSYENSEIIEKRLVSDGPICKFYKGRSIGLDEWDGTDFSTPNNSYRTIITKKAADILQRNKISNMHLDNLAEVETPVSAVTGQY